MEDPPHSQATTGSTEPPQLEGGHVGGAGRPPQSSQDRPVSTLPKISGVALKEAKKAEKAAKRAKAKGGSGPANAGSSPSTTNTVTEAEDAGSRPRDMRDRKDSNAPKVSKSSSGRRESSAKDKFALSKTADSKQASRSAPVLVDGNPINAYLDGLSKPKGLRAATSEVHPAVLRIGLKMANHEISGSAARCTALLVALKSVIRTYRTPPATALSRHLVQHLSPQIDFIKSCRPLTISMGNAIRWLKFEIAANTDVKLEDDVAKAELGKKIDNFIASKITYAARAIAESAADRIRPGDVVMTYARSSVVQQALAYASVEQKKRFEVIVVDDEVLNQGRTMANSLQKLGLQVVSCPFYSFNAVLNRRVTKVFLGANGMMGNGSLLARSGSSVVSRFGRQHGAGVFVLCETLKFSDRTPADSLVLNECLAFEVGSSATSASSSIRCHHLLYDLCPAEGLDLVITETAEGAVPVEAVPLVHRMMMDYENQGTSDR